MNADRCILVLGGSGLVGAQVVREIARELEPERIIVASLFRGEVREFLHDVRREFPHIEFIGAWGDVFVRNEFSEERRRRIIQGRLRRDKLYQDLYGELEEAYERSALAQLIRQYKPNVIVDSINTATAISYQDVHSLSQKTHDILQELRRIVDHEDLSALETLGRDLEQNVSMLLISQSIPQLIRHAQIIHKAMTEVKTRLYLKIGTTGTGGHGLKHPLHSQRRPAQCQVDEQNGRRLCPYRLDVPHGPHAGRSAGEGVETGGDDRLPAGGLQDGESARPASISL